MVQWLRAHPTVDIVCRDRSGLFAEAIRQGAPHAMQVMDRFHLVANLRDALERFCLRHRHGFACPTSSRRPPASPHQQRRQELTTARWYRVQALRSQGTTITAIARQLHLSRPTVYRYLSLSSPPERRQHRRPTQAEVARYAPYIVQRGNAGCRTAQQIYREVVALGCRLSRRTVERFVGELRQETGIPYQFTSTAPAVLYTEQDIALKQPMTPLQAARLLVARPDRLQDTECERLPRLLAIDAMLPAAYDLTQQFGQMVRHRQGASFDRWLQHVEPSNIPELHAFATRLRKDETAVRAGLTEIWSNGPTEGFMHRVKLIKRQGYGRGAIEWLRRRLLAASGCGK